MNTTLLRLLAGSVAGVFLLIGGAASAADLPRKKAPLAPAPAVIVPWTWTGFYASLQGGYAWDGSIVFIGPWNKGFGDTGGFGGPNVGYITKLGRSLSARKPAMISPTPEATRTPFHIA
jgi:outer membrane immunogenic protein